MKRILILLITLLLLLAANPAGARFIPRFQPYTVVDITPKTFVLGNRAGDQYELNRNRWPGVKVGEVIYYDKKLNRLWGVDRQRNKYQEQTSR